MTSTLDSAPEWIQMPGSPKRTVPEIAIETAAKVFRNHIAAANVQARIRQPHSRFRAG